MFQYCIDPVVIADMTVGYTSHGLRKRSVWSSTICLMLTTPSDELSTSHRASKESVHWLSVSLSFTLTHTKLAEKMKGKRSKKQITAFWSRRFALYRYIATREKAAASHTGGGDGNDIEAAQSGGKLEMITDGDASYSEATCRAFRDSWRWEMFDNWYV